MTSRNLLREVIDLLRQLGFCSAVAAPVYGPRSRSGATGSILPVGDGDADYWISRYNKARDDRTRGLVVDDLRAHVRALRVRLAPPPAAETQAQRDDRIVQDYQGWTCDEVARNTEFSSREVRRARGRAGREPDRGNPTPAVRLPRDQRQLRVVELAGQGLGQREIARQLGEHEITVRRDLAKAAA